MCRSSRENLPASCRVNVAALVVGDRAVVALAAGFAADLDLAAWKLALNVVVDAAVERYRGDEMSVRCRQVWTSRATIQTRQAVEHGRTIMQH